MCMLRGKKIVEIVQEQLHGLEATRQLLLQEAAVPLLGSGQAPPPPIHAAADGASRTKTISSPVTRMLPILR